MNISTYVITKGLVMSATGINMNRVLNLYMLFPAAYRSYRSYVKRKHLWFFEQNIKSFKSQNMKCLDSRLDAMGQIPFTA